MLPGRPVMPDRLDPPGRQVVTELREHRASLDRPARQELPERRDQSGHRVDRSDLQARRVLLGQRERPGPLELMEPQAPAEQRVPLDLPGTPEPPELSDPPDLLDLPESPDRPEPVVRRASRDQPGRPGLPVTPERRAPSELVGRPDLPEASDRPDQSEPQERPEPPGRPELRAQPEPRARPGPLEKPDPPALAERPVLPDRPDRPEPQDRPVLRERPARPAHQELSRSTTQARDAADQYTTRWWERVLSVVRSLLRAAAPFTSATLTPATGPTPRTRRLDVVFTYRRARHSLRMSSARATPSDSSASVTNTMHTVTSLD